MRTIAITGATGFVGKRMIVYNSQKFQQVILSLRDSNSTLNLTGVDAIVHLAGKAHQMQPIADNVYFEVNYELTKQLANKAKANGVKQFIYISSTKVYGDEQVGILTESTSCKPTDAYGASKLKAEQYLQSIETDFFKIAIVRPPLVYGPEVKGNMIRLMQLASKKIPLPFGKISNARSMVFVDNLIELINTIILKEASGVFIAGDSEPVSTDSLLLLMRTSMANKKGLISVPFFLRNIIKWVKPALYIRLFGSFVVSNARTNNLLNFIPPYSTAYGVEQMVNWFKTTSPAK